MKPTRLTSRRRQSHGPCQCQRDNHVTRAWRVDELQMGDFDFAAREPPLNTAMKFCVRWPNSSHRFLTVTCELARESHVLVSGRDKGGFLETPIRPFLLGLAVGALRIIQGLLDQMAHFLSSMCEPRGIQPTKHTFSNNNWITPSPQFSHPKQLQPHFLNVWELYKFRCI
jgi:hypothetical protein